jgi:DNA modification methylase
MKPYYEHNGITIFLGDCRDILPHLEPVDLVLTDPPYPNFNQEHGKTWDVPSIESWFYLLPAGRRFIFWPASFEFPYKYNVTAVHIWHKPNGQSNQHYECIYEVNGFGVYRVFRVPIINYKTLPEWTPHPAQKPLRLVLQLLNLKPFKEVVDPFMGSGTTLIAAKQLGRKAIGIEIEEKYVEIAIRRLSQEVFEWPK